MTDLVALSSAIRAERGTPVSRLGYFCAPFQPDHGPLSDRVIKVYRGLRDKAVLDRLARAHADYVTAIRASGVPLPDTAFHLLEDGPRRIPVIVQEALPQGSLMRPRMMAEPLADTLTLMQAAGEVIARFWHWSVTDEARQLSDRIGFHPSIRNLAVIDGTAVFFDTFPPLIGYSRDDMGQLLLLFSESRLMRTVGPLVQARLTAVQDEWYSPPETLVGLVGSACRLRPEHAGAYLDWGRGFARDAMGRWADATLADLEKPPQLPGYWTGFRRAMGLQGAPNVRPPGA